jgi:LPXTG-site transpeptidase (sortase) family protein
MHRNRVRLLAIGAIVFLVGAGLVAWRVVALQQTALEARRHLVAAREALSDVAVSPTPQTTASTDTDQATLPISRPQLVSACAEATAASTELADVSGQLQAVMPLVKVLESMPVVGAQTRTQSATLDAGTQIAAAGTTLCDGLAPLAGLFTSASGAESTGSAGDLLKDLVAAQPKLLAATDRLEQLEASLNQLQDQDLEPGNRTAVLALQNRLPQAISTMRDAAVLLDLLGSSRPRRYLLISQNPDEIRATGGYIGSAGIVEASGGRIQLVEYGTSRRYDTPPDMRVMPPPEFENYLGSAQWNLAAANWWVSFPDVARQLAYFFSLSYPDQPVDGVIALDQFGLERLLEVIGPVDVPEYGERVGAGDVQAKLDHYVHAGDASDESGRKQFTAALSAAVLQAALSGPRHLAPQLANATRSALDAQHLLIWTPDPVAAQLFASHRWDGGLLPTSSGGDSLMLVDTDVVGSKQSQAVSRDVSYAMNLTEPTEPTASLKVLYTNTARPEQRPEVQFVPEYRTFLRVFAPAGAELSSSSGFAEPAVATEECGRRVFAGEVRVPKDGTALVTLDYRLLPMTGYDLVVQRQPGVPPGELSVAITTSDGALARAELPNAAGQSAHWRLDSETEQLQAVSLPDGQVGGCGMQLGEAAPIAAPASIDVGNVNAQIVELGVDDSGQMEAPPTPDVVGWYRTSSRPGQPGNSVMSGHVDWGHNTAVFWGLKSLRPGDPIRVTGADGQVHTYAVEWNDVFPLQTAQIDRIVGPSKDSVLTLITCDGVYDTRQHMYSQRRVVRAQLVD